MKKLHLSRLAFARESTGSLGGSTRLAHAWDGPGRVGSTHQARAQIGWAVHAAAITTLVAILAGGRGGGVTEHGIFGILAARASRTPRDCDRCCCANWALPNGPGNRGRDGAILTTNASSHSPPHTLDVARSRALQTALGHYASKYMPGRTLRLAPEPRVAYGSGLFGERQSWQCRKAAGRNQWSGHPHSQSVVRAPPLASSPYLHSGRDSDWVQTAFQHTRWSPRCEDCTPFGLSLWSRWPYDRSTRKRSRMLRSQ